MQHPAGGDVSEYSGCQAAIQDRWLAMYIVRDIMHCKLGKVREMVTGASDASRDASDGSEIAVSR